jgi:GTP pyrophosphokinase
VPPPELTAQAHTMTKTKEETEQFSQLIAAIPAGYSPESHKQINAAYIFARQELGERQNPAGEQMVAHGLAVARIIAELGLDVASIQAAVLHETTNPNVPAENARVRNAFGAEVANLVEGLNNLQAYTTEDGYQRKVRVGGVENLEAIRRAVLVLIGGDVRIIILRMAKVLQVLRVADDLPPPQQQEAAWEAMYIYAPLANRLGVWQLKWQLEDMAFKYLEPEMYKQIAQGIAEKRHIRREKIQKAISQLQSRVNEIGIKAHIFGRSKHIYSIFRKMERKDVPLNQIFDIEALRVIVDTTHLQLEDFRSRAHMRSEANSLCYQVLGVVHNLWQPISQEFDDYIASPKPNGYHSLHTAVLDEQGNRLEVQIRTDKMDEEAELGIAAHWKYKEDGLRTSATLKSKIEGYRSLLADLQEMQDSVADSDRWQKEIFGERIYVFTPQGDVIDLPAGATPIDFAYHIHTQIGHHCRQAKVNGKVVSLDYQLKSGDKVEIETDKRRGPSRDWMNESLGYAASARTRNRIRQWFRQQERDQNITYGRQIVERELKRLSLADTFTVTDIADALRFEDEDNFLAKVGFGDIQAGQVAGAIYKLKQKLRPDDDLLPLLESAPKAPGRTTVQGMGGLHTKMAGCCNPIPPEPIVGYITRGTGITIHRRTCKIVENITERERLIDLTWGEEQERYPIPVVVRAYHRTGLVEEIANLLKGRKITVPSTKRTTDNSITSLYMVVEVVDLDELQWLLQRLEKVPNVLQVRRQKWTA